MIFRGRRTLNRNGLSRRGSQIPVRQFLSLIGWTEKGIDVIGSHGQRGREEIIRTVIWPGNQHEVRPGPSIRRISPGTTPLSAGCAAVVTQRARKKMNPAAVCRVNAQEAPLLDRQTILDALHRVREFVQAGDSYCVRLYGKALIDDLRLLAKPLKVSLKVSSCRAVPPGYAADQIGLSPAAVRATEKLVLDAIRSSQAGDYVAAEASIQKADRRLRIG